MLIIAAKFVVMDEKFTQKGKKRSFSRMMTRLSRADGHFGPSEQAFVNEILIMCDVPFVHK